MDCRPHKEAAGGFYLQTKHRDSVTSNFQRSSVTMCFCSFKYSSDFCLLVLLTPVVMFLDYLYFTETFLHHLSNFILSHYGGVLPVVVLIVV